MVTEASAGGINLRLRGEQPVMRTQIGCTDTIMHEIAAVSSIWLMAIARSSSGRYQIQAQRRVTTGHLCQSGLQKVDR